MYGAIIGDLAGSIYEYEQFKNIKSLNINEIITEKSFFTDDTILTIAILDAYLNGKDYDRYLKLYNYKYLDGEKNKSTNNSVIARVSPIGFLGNSEYEVRINSKLATEPIHDNDAVRYSTMIALVIYYLKKGLSLDEVYYKFNIDSKYIPFDKINNTYDKTIDNCLYVLRCSDGFEDSIKNAVNMGGDTNTNGAIVGSMAEALYGIDNELIEEVNKKIPNEFVKVLKKGYKKIN